MQQQGECVVRRESKKGGREEEGKEKEREGGNEGGEGWREAEKREPNRHWPGENRHRGRTDER
jgi:hypothetical protein